MNTVHKSKMVWNKMCNLQTRKEQLNKWLIEIDLSKYTIPT